MYPSLQMSAKTQATNLCKIVTYAFALDREVASVARRIFKSAAGHSSSTGTPPTTPLNPIDKLGDYIINHVSMQSHQLAPARLSQK
jgi:hypothetical protein